MKHIALFVVLATNIVAGALLRGQYFSGETIPGFALMESFGINEALSINISQEKSSKNIHVWLVSKNKPVNGSHYIEDELILKLQKHQVIVGHYGCLINKIRHKNIIAISKFLPTEGHHTKFDEAWAADLAKQRFEKISILGLVCIEPRG